MLTVLAVNEIVCKCAVIAIVNCNADWNNYVSKLEIVGNCKWVID